MSESAQYVQKPMFLTTREASKILGYRSTYVNQLANRGRIRSVKIGIFTHFFPEDIYEFKERRDQLRQKIDGTMTVREVAEYLDVKDDTVYRYAWRNKIRHFYSEDGRLLFAESDVKRFAEERTHRRGK